MSGYQAAMVCRKVHVARPSERESGGQGSGVTGAGAEVEGVAAADAAAAVEGAAVEGEDAAAVDSAAVVADSARAAGVADAPAACALPPPIAGLDATVGFFPSAACCVRVRRICWNSC